MLHDVFGVPFDEIAPIVDRTPEATRQLASRARRRVRGSEEAPDRSRPQREVVEAFLAASREGDFEGLLAMLDPDVVLRADATVVSFGAAAEAAVRGTWPQTFAGRAKAAQLALVDGVPGLAWLRGGRPAVVFDFLVDGDRIVGIDMLGDPDLLGELELSLLED